MGGIFGHLAFSGQYSAKDRLADMMHSLQVIGYSIAEAVYDDACFVGKTDIQSAGSGQLPTEAAKVNAVVSGEIYDGDIGDSVLSFYRQGRLEQVKPSTAPLLL